MSHSVTWTWTGSTTHAASEVSTPPRGKTGHFVRTVSCYAYRTGTVLNLIIENR